MKIAYICIYTCAAMKSVVPQRRPILCADTVKRRNARERTKHYKSVRMPCEGRDVIKKLNATDFACALLALTQRHEDLQMSQNNECHTYVSRKKRTPKIQNVSKREKTKNTGTYMCTANTQTHKNIFRQWRELSLGTNRCFAPCQWDVRAHVRVPASEFTFNCMFHAGEEMKIAHSNYRHSWSNVARRASIRVYGDTTNWRVFGVLTRKNSNFLGIQIRAIKKCANCRAIPQTRNMRRETKRLLVFGMSVRVPL